MEKYIEILEKTILEHEKYADTSYYSIEVPAEYREKEIIAIKHLLEEYKKLNSRGSIVCLIL